jgi:hypothetical protein
VRQSISAWQASPERLCLNGCEQDDRLVDSGLQRWGLWAATMFGTERPMQATHATGHDTSLAATLAAMPSMCAVQVAHAADQASRWSEPVEPGGR